MSVVEVWVVTRENLTAGSQYYYFDLDLVWLEAGLARTFSISSYTAIRGWMYRFIILRIYCRALPDRFSWRSGR